MAPVANRLTIDSTGSTSSIGTGWHVVELELRTGRGACRAARSARRPARVYFLKMS